MKVVNIDTEARKAAVLLDDLNKAIRAKEEATVEEEQIFGKVKEFIAMNAECGNRDAVLSRLKEKLGELYYKKLCKGEK